MSVTRNLVATTDAFVELETPGAVQFNFQVKNAGVLIEFGETAPGSGARSYTGMAEHYYPGPASVMRAAGVVRWKSITPGVPAIISITALTATEMGE